MDRYWRELERMAAADPFGNARIFSPLGNAPAESHRAGPWRRALNKYVLYPQKVARLRADFAHVLDHSYAHLLRRLPAGIRAVVTAFDLVPLVDSRGLSAAQVRRFEKVVRNLPRAELVLAMSHQTERDLIRFAGVSPDRIRVVYPGTDVAAFSMPVADFPAKRLLPPDARLLLSVGDTGPRKNLPFLLDALAPMSTEFRRGRRCLVRVGKLMEPELAARFRELLGNGFLEVGPRFGAELIGLYQSAHIFLMPSTLEGFSFTMMEAMAAGIPVVANRTTTNPEVGQDAVLYHEPGDASGAAGQIEHLLNDVQLWQEYKSRGAARIAELTWERHWRSVKEAYRSVLSQS